MTINFVCGQSARDDINDVIHTQLLYIIDRSVIIVIIIIIIIVIIIIIIIVIIIIIIIVIIIIIIIVIIKNNNRVRSHWSFFYLLRI